MCNLCCKFSSKMYRVLKNLITKRKKVKKVAKKKGKVEKVMHEFKEKELHSGSKKGKVVTSRKQALAIAISEKKKGKK